MPDETPLLRVLLVEDEPRLRETLLRALRALDCAAAGAGSAEEALRLLEAEAGDAPRTDVVLTDLQLPGASGLALLERLRALRPALQAVVLTGHGGLEAAQAAMRLDAVDFLTKPCGMGELERALARAKRRLQPPDEKPRLAAGAEAPEDDEVPPPPAPMGDGAATLTLAEVEKRHILQVLSACGGHRRQAAAQLGISLRLLYYRLRQYERGR